jgi:hypothetical protein
MMKKLLMIGAALVIAAAPVRAQTCVGAAIKPGSLAIGGGFAIKEDATSYHAAVNGNQTGGLFWNVAGGITHYDQIDTNGKDITGSVGFKAHIAAPISICPRVEVGYSWWSVAVTGASVDVKSTYGTLGAGIGYDLPGKSNVAVGFFATPELVVQKNSASFSDAGPYDTTDSETNKAFGSNIGATLGFNRLFVTGYTFITTMDNTKAVFGVNVGFAVR